MRTRSNSYGRKRIKIKDENFDILKPNEYIKFLDYDYNVKQLKIILKSYGLKISGNKNQLNDRVFTYMKSNYFATVIQKNIRGMFMLHFYNMFNKKKKLANTYNNETDFYTMEKLEYIPNIYKYIYKDDDNFVWGFKISSLIKHFEMKNFKNPYNRASFNDNILKEISYIKKIYNIYPYLSEAQEEENEIILSRKQKVLLKLNDFFSHIDSLGNYSNVNWLTRLSKRGLAIFIRELFDIWNYRAQLSDEAKKNICPPNGTPFININIVTISRHQDYIALLETCVKIFSNLLNTTANDSNKSLGALYILSALTMVSEDAADALPWLYQSVAL